MDSQLQGTSAANGRNVVLGIHDGMTTTRMVIMDSTFSVLAQTESEPGGVPNQEDAGQRLRQQVLDCLRAANMQAQAISAIGITSRTLNEQDDARILGRLIAELFPARPVVIQHEAIAALIAETGHHFGLLALCDADSSVIGLNSAGERLQVGGWGHYVRASGSNAVARDALSAAAKHFDGTGGATKLSAQIMMRLDLHTPADLMAWLRAPRCAVDDILALAEEVVALEDTDAIASGIISQAADNLAFQVQAAARRLGLEGERFPLLMVGNLFQSSTLLRTLFSQSVQTFLPGAVTTLAPNRGINPPAALTPDFAQCAGKMALDRLGISLPQIELNPPDPPRRATEQRNPLTVGIQERPTLDFVRLMNAEDARVLPLIESALDQIAALIDSAARHFDGGGRLLFVGAGTSGRLAVLDATECRPTFGTTPEEVAGILAGGEAALIHSIEGAEDDEAQGHVEIAGRSVNEHDTVIGIAASGSTPFVMAALREAQQRGALTGCVVNNVDSAIAKLVQHPIVIPTGPEVIMGSTRLKAGTAQKLVLNMISTGVMMRVGRTYSNLMVNMHVNNQKLRGRAAVIVAEATGLPLPEAVELLDLCEGDMKTAVGAYRLNLSPAEARTRLQLYNGNLYRCLQAGLIRSHDG